MIAAVSRLRSVNAALPTEQGRQRGLAYTLWLPGGEPVAGVVVLHGAGSCKESHHDFARAGLPLGIATVCFDQRGHGESEGPMDGRAMEDAVAMAELVGSRAGGAPIALRGSSMGGYLALLAARPAGAGAVVAICPASGEGLLRGLRTRSLRFEADLAALEPLLSGVDLGAEVDALELPVLLLHAEGDQQVPVAHSRELATRLRHPDSRLITTPGGHHRSIQHDDDLQAVSLRFIGRALAGVRDRG
jgi:alpha-beta hydrolase superfamily lysophospholipase